MSNTDPINLHFKVLSDEKIERIYQATLECLERTGVNVLNAEARDLFASAGAHVEDVRVRIPPHLIQEALASCPNGFTLWGRDRQISMDVFPGQAAVLRFSAFDIRTTPEINGTVTRVSADTTTDQRTGQSYYTIRVALPTDVEHQLGNIKLLPGMPVEAFVQTGERTVISYLMKPLHDQFMRAFREK